MLLDILLDAADRRSNGLALVIPEEERDHGMLRLRIDEARHVAGFCVRGQEVHQLSVLPRVGPELRIARAALAQNRLDRRNDVGDRQAPTDLRLCRHEVLKLGHAVEHGRLLDAVRLVRGEHDLHPVGTLELPIDG